MRAWSFSVYDTYGSCPKQYHEVTILKNYPFVKGELQFWGDRVHKALELRVRDDTPLDKELAVLEPLGARFAAMKATHTVLCEQKMAVTKDLKPTEYFAKDVWIRAVGDIIIISKDGKKAFIGDYKTGKKKYTLQLDLMALVLKCYYPDLEEITAAFIWLKGEPMTTKRFDVRTPKAIANILAKFTPRLKEMIHSEKTGIYPAKPSGVCKQWCAVTKCAYNGKYEGLK